MRFIVITGLSGSGKSTAAQVLEDEGYYVVDNFPLSLLAQLLEQKDFKALAGQGIALVIDARNPDFISTDLSVFDVVSAAGHQLEIYYFDATDDALIRRYSTTRRRHPLASYSNIASAIASERGMLHRLREAATVVFDTTELSVHQLKASVLLQLNGSSENTVPLTVRLQSFGFRYGVPLESDLVIDVRFLPNPHYVESLRPLCGQDQPVSDYVLGQPVCQEFLDKTASWLDFLLPHYSAEGKSYLTVSIGCTGGHHRSVAIVEALYSMIIVSHNVKRFHRDLVKEEG
ncbi:MAG: RNase adaptor protein RapZ [Desulfobacteraceae bacterium 4572_35.2]|nr:MAG: RNase adaptor protein RapZ [Desulfobacteraceae bacterium 4572_35.2]